MKGVLKYGAAGMLIVGLFAVAFAQTQPDILVQDPISISPLSVEQGETITVVASVFNSNPVAVTGSFEVSAFVFDQAAGTVELPDGAIQCLTSPKETDNSVCVINGLSAVGGANNTVEVRFEINTTAVPSRGESYTIIVDANSNPADQVNEASSTNNTGSGEVFITARTANVLILADFSLSPASPKVGDLLTVVFNIENDRLVNVPPFDIRISIRQRSNGSFAQFLELVPPALSCPGCISTTLSSGQRRSVEARIATVLLDPGDYQMQIQLDPGNVITEEFNEGDNALTFDFTLAQPTRNLSVTSGQLLPAIAENSQDVVVSFDVTNTSNVAAENVGLTVELLGLPDAASQFVEITAPEFTCTPVSAFVTADLAAASAPCDTISIINPNETLSLQARFNTGLLPLQTYDVLITLDPAGDFDETSEEDNSLAIFLTVAEQQSNQPRRGPELHPVSLDLVPDSPITQGTSVLVISNIKNSGNENADEFEVRFSYRSADGGSPSGFQVFESESISLLKIGISQDVKATLDTTGLDAGLYDIKVELFTPNQIELDENNNSVIAEFTIVVE